MSRWAPSASLAPCRRQKQLPAPERLRAALAGVGYQHLQLDAAGRKARLGAAGMRLDFGAVAVGYAVDEALTVLRQHGLTRVLVNGSVIWRSAIRPPANQAGVSA